ncbi:MAG TPA: hypothetical protein VKU35_02940 [Candidatus Limnocylindria bacterium]|nr:hypothetical protein [Candidatus Limnocylindria bacterium]
MAVTRITPIPARVRWDRNADRPGEVRWADRQLTVRSLAAVRDERHAYRPDRGPRITMLLDADGGQAVLVFDAVRRRWYLEGLDPAA